MVYYFIFTGTVMAAEYVDTDWGLSFIYPGLVMGAVGAVVWLFLIPEPRAVGLSTGIDRQSVYKNKFYLHVRKK